MTSDENFSCWGKAGIDLRGGGRYNISALRITRRLSIVAGVRKGGRGGKKLGKRGKNSYRGNPVQQSLRGWGEGGQSKKERKFILAGL